MRIDSNQFYKQMSSKLMNKGFFSSNCDSQVSLTLNEVDSYIMNSLNYINDDFTKNELYCVCTNFVLDTLGVISWSSIKIQKRPDFTDDKYNILTDKDGNITLIEIGNNFNCYEKLYKSLIDAIADVKIKEEESYKNRVLMGSFLGDKL